MLQCNRAYREIRNRCGVVMPERARGRTVIARSINTEFYLFICRSRGSKTKTRALNIKYIHRDNEFFSGGYKFTMNMFKQLFFPFFGLERNERIIQYDTVKCEFY